MWDPKFEFILYKTPNLGSNFFRHVILMISITCFFLVRRCYKEKVHKKVVYCYHFSLLIRKWDATVIIFSIGRRPYTYFIKNMFLKNFKIMLTSQNKNAILSFDFWDFAGVLASFSPSH